jgi:predicted outer membrane repeat protein
MAQTYNPPVLNSLRGNSRPSATVLTVTNINDSGAGSLRDQIAAASAGDTIDFSLPANSIIVLNSTIYINKQLTIDGSTATNLTVDGNKTTQVFSVTDALNIRSLTIQNGKVTGSGGGINTTQPITLSDTSFLANTASVQGGGLYAGSTAVMINTSFISNTTTSTSFTSGGGGAMVVGTATVSGGTFARNTAPGNVFGGGLATNSTLNLTDTQFLTNTSGNRGGGLYVGGNSTIANATFSNNTSTSSFGGGAYLSGAATVSGGTFTGNKTTGNSSGGLGGGLYTASTLNLTGTQFLSNTSLAYGGGLYTFGAGNAIAITNATFISNIASGNPGGGAYFSGPATVNGGTFALNTASNTANGNGGGLYASITLNLTGTQFLTNTAGFRGGGLYAAGNSSAVIITNANFISNTATNNRGGGAYFAGPATVSGGMVALNTASSATTGFGGGLIAGNTLNLTGTQFLTNSAGVQGGGLYANNSTTLNGALFQNNQCTASGCTSNGLYANSVLTITQIVTTSDHFDARNNWVHNGTLTQNYGAVWMNGIVAQTISGSGVPTFASLVISNSHASGVTLGQNITVTNQITLTTDLTTTTQVLTLGPSATVTGAGDVIGTVRRSTPTTGSALQFNNQYTTINFETAPTQMDVKLTRSAPSGLTTAVGRYYTLSPTGSVSATIQLAYKTSELNGTTEANEKLWRFDTGLNRWTLQGGTANTTNHFVQLGGVTQFSDWAISDNGAPTAVKLSSFKADTKLGWWQWLIRFFER